MDESTLSTLLRKASDNLDPKSSQVDLEKALQEGRRRQWRTRATVSAAVSVVTAAAVATTVILPASSSPSKTAPLAGSSSQPTVKAPAPGKSSAAAQPTATTKSIALPPTQTSASPVSYTFTADTDVTVADVLTEAAHGVQASQSTRATPGGPEADVPLVNGWPDVTYWHTLTQWTDSACPGQVENSNSWLGQDGSQVVENKVVGPKSVNQTLGCFGGVTKGAYSVMGNPVGVQLGGKLYTWSQWAALPTDPAKLWPIVQADANVGVAPGKGGIAFAYTTIALLLANDPVSPAMRGALFEVMEKIPGVTVAGQYTDSLGRTGTALTLNDSAYLDWTVVIDTSNGQLLAQLSGAPPIPPGCVRVSETGDAGATCTVGGSGLMLFISAGPANSAPTPRG